MAVQWIEILKIMRAAIRSIIDKLWNSVVGGQYKSRAAKPSNTLYGKVQEPKTLLAYVPTRVARKTWNPMCSVNIDGMDNNLMACLLERIVNIDHYLGIKRTLNFVI